MDVLTVIALLSIVGGFLVGVAVGVGHALFGRGGLVMAPDDPGSLGEMPPLPPESTRPAPRDTVRFGGR